MTTSSIGPDPDPLDRLKRAEEIERIRWEERKKGGSGGPPDEPPEDEPKAFTRMLYLFLERVIHILNMWASKAVSVASREPLRENLLLLQKTFFKMMEEDKSQDVTFLNGLSIHWLQLLIAASKNIELMPLIKDIESHPEHEEHTFGYYLEEYAGQKWLPFPYMEMIQKLHHEHLLDPPSSDLTRWTKMIEDLL